MTESTTRVAGACEALLEHERLQIPPAHRDPRTGRYVRADGGEWDAWYDLGDADRRWIRARYMSGRGIGVDVAAHAAGMTADQFLEELGARARAERRRSRDELEDWGEEPDPEELEPAGETPDPLDYATALRVTGELELVGPAEVAARARVDRSTITKWRRRHADFPAPLGMIGAGRVSPRGGAPVGTPVWHWPTVEGWLRATGRG